MQPQLLGIHHVTAVTAHASDNVRFYARVLGMRLVKKTVNQDDVSAYHLFYADAKGSPGSDLTFFDWAHSPKQRHGNNSISEVSLRVGNTESLKFWAARLTENKIAHDGVREYDARSSLSFQDPEGQRLRLIDDGGNGSSYPWQRSPVPAEHQIRGLGAVSLTIPKLGSTNTLLTELLGMRCVRTFVDPIDGEVLVYTMGEGGAAAEVYVRVRPQLGVHRHGAGGVHHVAFRVPDETAHAAWLRRLEDFSIPNSGIIDRFYFRSLYFREPNHILFELATDDPGFAVDENESELGERLALPPFLEPRRAEIEAGLKPLETP